MRNFILVTIAFFSFSGFAYQEGRFSCKNTYVGLPDNVYIIKNISVGVDGDKLPYVEVIRFSYRKLGDTTSGVVKSNVKGMATVFLTEFLPESLAIGAYRLEFDDKGALVGCIK